MEEIVSYLNGIAWGPWMLILLVGTGIYLSIRTGFPQFAKFGYAMKNTVGKMFKKQTSGAGEVTPFQALSTALAATVGTGNIAGVTGAILVGGPGAVFWMWISALFGMVTANATHRVTGSAALCTILRTVWAPNGNGWALFSVSLVRWQHSASVI